MTRELYGQMRPLCCRAVDVTGANPEHVLAALYDRATCPPTDVCLAQHRPGPLSQTECRTQLLAHPEERIEYVHGRFMGRLDLFTGYLCTRHWGDYYGTPMWDVLQFVEGCCIMMPVIRACAAACAPRRSSMLDWPFYGGDDRRQKPRPPAWKMFQQGAEQQAQREAALHGQ